MNIVAPIKDYQSTHGREKRAIAAEMSQLSPAALHHISLIHEPLAGFGLVKPTKVPLAENRHDMVGYW